MVVQHAELLTAEEVTGVHEASLEILERIGLLVTHAGARRRFKHHGCRVDADTGIVRFPPAVVDELRLAIPPKFTFHGREPQYDCTLPDDAPVIVTASSAPDVIDPVTGEVRRSTSDDVARIAHLVDQLPGYDIFSISVLADDVPASRQNMGRYYPALKNCRKPVRSSGLTPDEAQAVLEIGALIAGGEEAYARRPLVTHHTCPIISPLKMDEKSTDQLIYFTERGLPNFPSIVPNAGLTSPLTLAATLAQANAEFLAAAVLMQIVREGTPLIYSTLPTVGDMRTGAYAPGAVETPILIMGCAQMARYYNVPSSGYVGLTNAKTSDAQAGVEKALGSMAAHLGGLHLIQMGALLDALLVFDYGQAVIDSEMGEMLKRVERGIEFSLENLAIDTLAEIGPGGHFMDHPHTIAHMRSTPFIPRVAERGSRDAWEADGRLDMHARAIQCAREILTQPNPAALAPGLDARIRSLSNNLVAGDSIPCKGW